MKKEILFILLIISIVINSCTPPQKARVPQKITDSNQVPVTYFQNAGPKEEGNKKVVRLEAEEKVVTEKEEDIPVKTIENTVPEIETDKPLAIVKPEKELIKENVEAVSEPVIKEEKEVQNYEQDEQTNSITPSQTGITDFRIVTGSFQIRQNAERFIAKLKSSGYPGTYMEKGKNGFLRVIVNNIPDENEARVYLDNYRKNHPEYSDAWLLYNEDVKRVIASTLSQKAINYASSISAGTNFKIVSGSFSVKNNAESFEKILESIGYTDAYVEKGENGLYRVIVKNAQDELEARNFLSDYKHKQPTYADSWILN